MTELPKPAISVNENLIRRYPEKPRKPTITVRPKPGCASARRFIATAEARRWADREVSR